MPASIPSTSPAAGYGSTVTPASESATAAAATSSAGTPAIAKSGSSTEKIRITFDRGNGEVVLVAPAEQLQGVMDCANRHFGDPTRDLGGPALLPPPK
jgi:hypothetical protein